MLARRSRGQRLKPDGKPGEQLQDPCPFRKTVAGRKIMQKLHVRAHHGRAKAIAAHEQGSPPRNKGRARGAAGRGHGIGGGRGGGRGGGGNGAGQRRGPVVAAAKTNGK